MSSKQTISGRCLMCGEPTEAMSSRSHSFRGPVMGTGIIYRLCGACQDRSWMDRTTRWRKVLCQALLRSAIAGDDIEPVATAEAFDATAGAGRVG
jgi:hypothetical protein